MHCRSLSLAAPGLALNDEKGGDDTVQLRHAANDFVDSDETTPLPALGGSRSANGEQSAAWWEKVRTYIGI